MRNLCDFVRKKNPIIDKRLPAWRTFERDLQVLSNIGRVEVPRFVSNKKYEMPLITIAVGNPDPQAPVVGFFGGVHGLEVIGAQVVLSFLHTLVELSAWDDLTQELLRRVRILFFPIVNPIGLLAQTRCNENGVDLMRNAAVDAMKPTPWIGGHRTSKRLPWYRGELGQPMEVGSQVLTDFVSKETRASRQIICLDVHSGFGFEDQIWFPYAHKADPFLEVGTVHLLKEKWENAYPHHFYKFEPQAKVYSTHGDLWDALHLEWLTRRDRASKDFFLPLCLEMGSFTWLKKNPLQLTTAAGLYNPIKVHRLRRILRRHQVFFDFLLRIQMSGLLGGAGDTSRDQAMKLWYS